MQQRLENWLSADPKREVWVATIIDAVFITATFVAANMIISS